jgi:hypothetical protein
MENQSTDIRRVMLENEELKRALALSLNQPLIKKLKDALGRINSGEYLTEKEFFRN